MNADRIAYWNAQARANWTYLADDGPDQWRDHSDDVLAGRAWADDCDGLAMTTVALCARDGAAPADCFRLVVEASDGSGGHMVGSMKDDAGNWWVVGDTFFPRPYPAGQMQHTPKDYNCMANIWPKPVWDTGVPWLANQ